MTAPRNESAPGWLASGPPEGAATPETAVQGFSEIIARTACPFAVKANIQAAPAWAPGDSMTGYLARASNGLSEIMSSSLGDTLDGYLIPVPPVVAAEGMSGVTRFVRDIISELLTADPVRPRALAQERVTEDTWRLSFAGMDYFLAAFAPFYNLNHPRWSGPRKTAFVLLQPDSSFHRRVGRRGAATRRAIRARFEQAGQTYDTDRLEADKFLPVGPSPDQVTWYQGNDGGTSVA